MKKLPIVFICDENYAMPTTVAITSIREKQSSGYEYFITVLGVGLTECSIEKIEQLEEKFFHVKVLDVEFSELQKQVVQYRERVTPAALFKFELPNLFKEYNKVLYLDSDVVVQHDIVPLFEMDITEKYAAVVKDTMTERGKEGHLKRIQFKEEAYFNSGMLLLNLKKMREDNMPEKLLDYRLNGLNHFMDQDTLNVVFAGNVKYISPYYNLLNCFFEWQSIEELSDFYEMKFPRNKEAIYKNAVVLHFGDKKKPWQYDMGFLSDVYKKYYNKSPYVAIPLNLIPINENKKQKNKIKGFIQCYKDHGLVYTFKRSLEHLGIPMGIELKRNK